MRGAGVDGSVARGATTRLPHLRALDGLRGVAVALVVAYHLAPDLVPGGFLGVDVFFVLSGFLITSLLVEEVRTTGRVALRDFWVRRVRRLAPALLLLVAGLAAYAQLWAAPGELPRLRAHSLWTLGYLANWKLILDGTTYTDLVVGESPLRHAWSLAIEEQFYVLFPLVVWALARLAGSPTRLRQALVVLGAAGAVASAAWMVVVWGDGRDPSRGYFGTDTRAQSLLAGVVLGAVLVGRPPREGNGARAAALLALPAAAFLVGAVLTAEELDAWLQHGGFLLVALAVAALIAAMERAAWLRRPLSLRPLVGLGTISYGVYLWHWPVVVLVDEARTGRTGVALAALRLALTLAAALLSHRLVERPIRRGALGRTLGRWAVPVAPAATALAAVAVLATTAVSAPPRTSSVLAATTPAGADGPAAPTPAVQPPGGEEPPLRLVIVGDSVAHTLAGGTVGESLDFEPWSPEQSSADPTRAELWSVARPACSYLPGGIVIDGRGADFSSFCDGWEEDLEAVLGAWPGATVVVALSNDASDRDLGGRIVPLGSPEHDRYLTELLDGIRARTEAADGELVLLALPPRTGRAARPEDRDGRRDRLMRAALQRYVEDHPEVRLLDLFDVICPDGDCGRPPAGFDPAWRYDGLHYEAEGARWVVAWLVARLRS